MNEECLASLRFDNTRYDKISREHRGSFEWIWDHNQYRDWSTSDTSRLLYIQGKPGSGKSTLTKYFSDHLQEREPAAKSAIVAKFFYSYREGELQRNHYNMLQSILYDILDQDKALFYYRFQTEYRDQRRREPRVAWDYESLKTVLKCLQDYPLERRLYLIIDAIDESKEDDRRNVLNLLFELCAQTKRCILKVFVASRPVGQLEIRRSQFHYFIRLQDETKSDISRFARSFLNRLSFMRLLVQATEYIVENAHGVFMWVKLVGEELLIHVEKGYSEEKIYELLRGLPTELEYFYTFMFGRMNKDKQNLPYAIKMFQFVLSARRPLTVDELLHALVIPDQPDTQFTPDNSFQRRIPAKEYIFHCGGNFLEIKPHHGTHITWPDSRNPQTNQAAGNGTVQVMHQTVREFFLDPYGHVANSEFRMCERDAHACISMTCIRYLMLCTANTTVAGRPADIKSWSSEHFKGYAQYLDKMPLANYALYHLKHHIDGSQQYVNIQGIIDRFIQELIRNPAVYLLEKWVSSSLIKISLSNEQSAAAKDFRNTVLLAAVRNGFSTAAEVLLAAGADVGAEDRARQTALHWAAWGGNEAVVRLLVERGAGVSEKDRDGRTALHWAAWRGNKAAAGLLVEGGADVRAKNLGGRTALHWAALQGHMAVVKLLVERGADINEKDQSGQMALHLARSKGQKAVEALLVNVMDGHPYLSKLRRDSVGADFQSVRKLTNYVCAKPPELRLSAFRKGS